MKIYLYIIFWKKKYIFTPSWEKSQEKIETWKEGTEELILELEATKGEGRKNIYGYMGVQGVRTGQLQDGI